ncbi:MAG: type II toxin-antitoxin system PemK/MazF family toxin [Chloroflexi bacterium]|nr:type II toxin-antitoxin system PemK/MazF family toxin [Chloroflexota bacterium]
MPIHQGDLFWVQTGTPQEPDIPHPHVIVQTDALNDGPVATVVVCALTSNLRRVSMPGNVLLEAGEAKICPCSQDLFWVEQIRRRSALRGRASRARRSADVAIRKEPKVYSAMNDQRSTVDFRMA